MSTVQVGFWGGPNDGHTCKLAWPLDAVFLFPGPTFDYRFEDSEIAVRSYRVYKYLLCATQEMPVYVFHSESIEPYDGAIAKNAGGGGNVGIRKHGVGEILQEEEISKEASKNWNDEDEQGLLDEGE